MRKLKFGLTLAIPLSVLVHITIIFNVSRVTPHKKINIKNQPIEVSVIKNRTSNKNNKKSAGKLKKNRQRIKTITSLNKIQPSNHASSFAKSFSTSKTHSKEFSGGDTNDGSYQKFSRKKGAFGVMNNMGITEYTKNIWFYEVLWNKVNSGLTYPEDFAKQRISGVVNIHAQVDKKGKLINFLEITGPESILKAYVMTNLISILKKPLPKKTWLQDREEIPILITIEFIIHELADPQYHNVDFSDQGNHLKNTFLIKKRRVINNRVAQYYAENVAPFIPPIIPIPGGFIIDFVAAYNMIDKWGEPTESVSRKRRLKSLKSLLEHTIKQQPDNYKQSPLNK